MSIRWLVPVSVVAAILTGAALAQPQGRAAGAPCSSGQVLKSASYVFALAIGPLEQMYTPAQVAAKHPTSGEVMLSGTMSGAMAGMGMSPSGERHLEVHICTSGGKVVTGAHPTIVVEDPAAKTMATRVPIATMEGVGEGSADYHYGNNVALGAGHHITVTVTLGGQKVVFHAVVPKASM